MLLPIGIGIVAGIILGTIVFVVLSENFDMQLADF